ncbi:hypothetical protein ABRZ08_13095 [Castellaniella ginsengisoli]|uniref:Uncharacterized protein n=1 Tax=Castellaniella ginsengisoli TaxID=546114 RepID=A0AB39G314_9BURK
MAVKYANEVIELMEAYPMRSFRVGELVRHVTRGRSLSVSEKAAARKAVKRVMDALVEHDAVLLVRAAEVSGAAAEYSVSRLRDIGAGKAGQKARQ